MNARLLLLLESDFCYTEENGVCVIGPRVNLAVPAGFDVEYRVGLEQLDVCASQPCFLFFFFFFCILLPPHRFHTWNERCGDPRRNLRLLFHTDVCISSKDRCKIRGNQGVV